MAARRLIPGALCALAVGCATAEPAVPGPLSCNGPIELTSALAAANAANPDIALAREAISARNAERLRADALALPTLNVGASFNDHQGALQSSRGVILD